MDETTQMISSVVLQNQPFNQSEINIINFTGSNLRMVPTYHDFSILKFLADRSYIQTGCANCLKLLDADLSWIVQCPSCKTECEVQLILKVTVQIDDGTAAIKTVLTSPLIDKLIAATPIEIRNAEEAGENIQDIVNKKLNTQQIVVFARAYETTYHRQPETRIFIIHGHNIDEGENSGTQPKIDSKKRKAIDISGPQTSTCPKEARK